MAKNFSLVLPIVVKNDFDKLYSVLRIYAKIDEVMAYNESDTDEELEAKLKQIKLPIEDKCFKVLTYYTMYGYSKETCNECRKYLNLTRQANTQIVSYLTRQGYLEKDEHNMTMRNIPQDLQLLKKLVLDTENNSESILSLKFINKND